MIIPSSCKWFGREAAECWRDYRRRFGWTKNQGRGGRRVGPLIRMTSRVQATPNAEGEGNMMKYGSLRIAVAVCMAFMTGFLPMQRAHADTAQEIDVRVEAALNRFLKEVKGAKEFLQSAKGTLIMPKVLQAGFIIGGEYGEGALRIGTKNVDYYSVVSGSLGYQIGAQQKDIILVFMTEASLKKFRTGETWQAGVDGTVTLLDIGAEGSIDTTTIKQPIVGFVFGQKGVMVGVSIEGSKFTRLKK
jgi:lipid-binding SYLF domain-containing protein